MKTKAEMNKYMSTHRGTVAAIGAVKTVAVMWLLFWVLPAYIAWLIVGIFVYIDWYLGLKRMGDKPIL